MGATSILGKIRRGWQQPPSVVAKRVAMELRRAHERILSRWRFAGFTTSQLLRATGAASVDELWTRLAARPFLSFLPRHGSAHETRERFQRCCPGREQLI